jgi:hypothetical protein
VSSVIDRRMDPVPCSTKIITDRYKPRGETFFLFLQFETVIIGCTQKRSLVPYGFPGLKICKALVKFFNDIFLIRHFCIIWKWLYTSFKTTKPFYGAIPLTIRLSVILTGTSVVKKRIIFYLSNRSNPDQSSLNK